MIGLLLVTVAFAGAPFSVADLAEPANELARCSGVWDAVSSIARAAEKPANADLYHQKANGARIAAQYFHGLKFNTENPAEQRPLSAWSDYVKGLGEVTATKFLAAGERDDRPTMARMLATCDGLIELQQAAIDLLRSSHLAPSASD
jgi:hypothetical protein